MFMTLVLNVQYSMYNVQSKKWDDQYSMFKGNTQWIRFNIHCSIIDVQYSKLLMLTVH